MTNYNFCFNLPRDPILRFCFTGHFLLKREKLRFDMSAVEEAPSVGSQESDTGIATEMKELGMLRVDRQVF